MGWSMFPASSKFLFAFQLLTVDPTLDQLGLPQYPPLPADTEPSKVRGDGILFCAFVENLKIQSLSCQSCDVDVDVCDLLSV